MNSLAWACSSGDKAGVGFLGTGGGSVELLRTELTQRSGLAEIAGLRNDLAIVLIAVTEDQRYRAQPTTAAAANGIVLLSAVLAAYLDYDTGTVRRYRLAGQFF